MSLHLYASNSLEGLSVQLNSRFAQKKISVFQPHYIVTQTEGMNHWLKLQLAHHNPQKIAANICFLKPNDIVQKAYRFLGGAYTFTYSADSLCWLLFKVLGEEDFHQKFPDVAAYFLEEKDAGGKKINVPDGVKQMVLARKLADLFDQYQIYRTELIEKWNDGHIQTLDITEWQQYIWLRAKEIAAEKFPDKTRLGRDVLKLLNEDARIEELKKRMPAVHVFGLSILTMYHIRILTQLAEHIDVHFYFLNPAPNQYWYDTLNEKQLAFLSTKGIMKPEGVALGNDLLHSWGKVIRDTFYLLFEQDDFLNAYTETGLEEPSSDTLLQKIQQDIFHNCPANNRIAINAHDLKDGTVSIQSCYTPAREVEALYNYLVHLIDQKKEKLSPRDIVVMVSDVDAYAPYIKAVFDNAPHSFPYTIADESIANSDNLFHALKLILETTDEEFKAETIVQLLDAAFIRKRFGLSHLSLIRKAVNKANIRFGVEGRNEDETVYVSWKYGLQRIMYGICFSGEDEFELLDDSIFPLDMVEGADARELVRFCHFVESLMDIIEMRKKARTLLEWIDYVNTVVHTMVFDAGDAVDEDYRLLQQQLRNYTALHDVVMEPLRYEVFCHHFLQTLKTTSRSGLFGSSGITFCSLLPMRSIPFTVVALLGLNFDKFPRREMAASFNLMQEAPQKGDRNIKDNDKHLFLETVLSAKKYLYISYLGQSVKDNSPLPPSALVDEFIDYMETGYKGDGDVRKQLIVRQPLHSFSRRYASGGDGLYTYLLQKEEKQIDFFNQKKQLEPVVHEEISLQSLISFFKNPFKTYYNQVLKIRYDEQSDLLNETELFTLDGLQQWGLKQELLLLKDEEREHFKKRLVKQGLLPLKNMAEISLQQTEAAILPIKKLFQEIVTGKEAASLPVALTINATELTGVIQHVYDHELVFVCFSKNECKHHLEAYIQYLAGCAMGSLNGLYFLSTEKVDVYKAPPLSKVEAMRRLEDLVTMYLKGHTTLLSFYPDFKIKPSDVANLDMEKFQKIVNDKLDNYNFPCTDQYILNEYQNGFFNNQDVLNDYKSACGVLLNPLAEIFPSYYQ